MKLTHLYKKYNIRYFKLDGINITAKKGEMNLLQMMKEVVKETAGKVYFNLDTTDQSRLGYFGQTQYGSIFLENRYTDFGNYFPHYTLRNLWQLSRYIPAQKLQMEFLNTARNKELYGEDPLSPAQCGIAYAFATTMFSNPLVWMEVSGLSKHDQETLKVVMKAYRRFQHEILNGHILPVGEEPSGTGWTGFQSIKNDKEGYLLLLKEYNFEPEGYIMLWKNNNQNVRLTSLITKIGTKSLETYENNEITEEVRRNNDGTFTFSLDEPYSFRLFKYRFD